VIYNADNFPELPRGWASLTVDNSVDSAGNSNKKLKSKDALGHGRFPVIDQGQSDVSGYSDDESLVVEASESSPVILFGDHTRLLKQISQPFVPGADGTKLFRAKSFWDTRFVYQMLRAIKLPDKGYARHFQYLRESVLPLPPLPEQKRIADKLDAVLARVNACRDRLDRIPAIFKRFRQSVLAAATSGKLTEDWRDGHRIEAEWQTVKFADIGELGRGKSKHRPRNDQRLYGGPYPFIQTGDIAQSGGQIKTHNQTYSEFGLSQSKLWPSGTVCITIAANIADTAILTYPACFPDSVVGFAADNEKCLPEFIKWSIDVISERIKSFAPATAQKNINLAILNDIEFQCPSITEQTEIVRRVESLLAFTDRLEARYQAARTQVEKLTPATLAKAFRGELVPQDPNDEPAAELLRRVAGKLAAKPLSKRTHKKPKPEQATTVAFMLIAKTKDDTMKKHLLTKPENIAPNHLADILHTIKQQDAKAVWISSELSIDDFYVQLSREINAGLLRVSKDDESRLELVSTRMAKG